MNDRYPGGNSNQFSIRVGESFRILTTRDNLGLSVTHGDTAQPFIGHHSKRCGPCLGLSLKELQSGGSRTRKLSHGQEARQEATRRQHYTADVDIYHHEAAACASSSALSFGEAGADSFGDAGTVPSPSSPSSASALPPLAFRGSIFFRFLTIASF